MVKKLRAKKMSLKKMLLVSALLLVLALTSLIGTTFAWFSDSTGSDINKIISGNLDVGMNYWNGENDEFLDASNVSLFNNDALWEPGHMEIAYLEIENLGNLSFNYMFAVYPTEEVPGYRKDGSRFYLSDYLTYAIIEYDVATQGEIASRDAAIDLISEIGMGISRESLIYGTIHPGSNSHRLALIVYMPTTVTSTQANHDLSSGKPAPSIRLAVDVYATQNTHEFDSFNDQYDSGLLPTWEIPLWRYAPEGYTVDAENKKIIVNSAEALKYLGNLYDDMVIHPLYFPEEWEIVLGSNIDFGGEVLSKPIRFGGFKSFDGNDKTITNVILNYIYVDEEFVSVGLFDELPSTKNLKLENVVVNSENTAAGILAGNLTGDSYQNIQITGGSVTGFGYVGGMFGYCNFLLPIDFSGIQILRTDISLFGYGFGYAGGIGGHIGGSNVSVSNSTVNDLNATGVTSSGSYVGGMFGEVDCDMEISLGTITEITVYRDVYIGAITGKIYSSRDVRLVRNSVDVVVSKDGVDTLVPLTASGENIEETGTVIDWDKVASVTNSPLQITHNGHFYEVFVTTSDITWTAAKVSCENKNGHLVTITSAEENNAVVTIVNRYAHSAWLGAYRPVCYGSHTGPHIFEWVTGEEWVYSNWDNGEPNDSHPHQGACENCLHMYGSGKWNDYQNDHSDMRGYVCEWDSLQSYLNYLTTKTNQN